MATHSSIPAWKTPWTEEPGGLQSMGSQRDTTKRLSVHACTHIRTQSQPLGGYCAVTKEVLNGYHPAQRR